MLPRPLLEFTPLEFETTKKKKSIVLAVIRIYSVGVWNAIFFKPILIVILLEFTPLEFETTNINEFKFELCD